MRDRVKQRAAEARYREKNCARIRARRKAQYDPVRNRMAHLKEKSEHPERVLARGRRSGKKYRETHQEELNAKARARYQLNKEKEKKRRIAFKLKHPEKVREWNRRNDARPERKARKAELEQLERTKRVRRIYRRNYPRTKYSKEYESTYHDRRRQLHHEKQANDPQYRLRKTLRSSLYHAVKKGWRGGSAIDSLGCSIGELKKHLEHQWLIGMSWENFGRLDSENKTWQIDHVMPLSKFDLTDPVQVAIVCHWTNLAPLWALDNRRKGNRIVSRLEVPYVP